VCVHGTNVVADYDAYRLVSSAVDVWFGHMAVCACVRVLKPTVAMATAGHSLRLLILEPHRQACVQVCVRSMGTTAADAPVGLRAVDPCQHRQVRACACAYGTNARRYDALVNATVDLDHQSQACVRAY
jgi:hypothetical protein